MAPVTFCRDTPAPVQPYFISPWQDEAQRVAEPVLGPLRGDFFCMPFGANPAWRGEHHHVHGETAFRRWRRSAWTERNRLRILTLTLRTKVRPGRVTKCVGLRDGENVVYVQHRLEGFGGRMPLGHHAILAPPDREGSMLLSTSPLQFGQTAPRSNLATSDREYHALAPNSRFKRLDHVPTIWKTCPATDCSVFPAREGFVDILSLYAKPGVNPAWTCAAVPSQRYVWFSLRDASVLPTTTIWMENRGRHGPPWDGRTCCIGLEDVCAYHAEGLKASVQANEIQAQGIRTFHTLSKRHTTTINCIQGVVQIPPGFDRVKTLRFLPGAVDFVAESGRIARSDVDHSFIFSGHMA